jgi:hypothetical protein
MGLEPSAELLAISMGESNHPSLRKCSCRLANMGLIKGVLAEVYST